MLGVSFAPFAVFLDIDFALDELAVLAGPIIDAAALRAGEFEKLILRHSECHYTQRHPRSQSKGHAVQIWFHGMVGVGPPPAMTLKRVPTISHAERMMIRPIKTAEKTLLAWWI